MDAPGFIKRKRARPAKPHPLPECAADYQSRAVGVFRPDVDVEELNYAQPDGFISARGSAWGDGRDFHPIVDIRIAVGRSRVEAVLTLAQARTLMTTLKAQIAVAAQTTRDAEDETRLGEPPDDGGAA